MCFLSTTFPNAPAHPPPPPYFLTSPLHDLHSACIKCRGSRKTVKLIQKLSPGKELRAPVQRLHYP